MLCISAPWPGIARTIYGDHDRCAPARLPCRPSLPPRTAPASTRSYLATYMRPCPGAYFTGDGAIRDADGMYWITGRVDGAGAENVEEGS